MSKLLYINTFPKETKIVDLNGAKIWFKSASLGLEETREIRAVKAPKAHEL
jgi:hypothetical protein